MHDGSFKEILCAAICTGRVVSTIHSPLLEAFLRTTLFNNLKGLQVVSNANAQPSSGVDEFASNLDVHERELLS